MNQDKQYHFTVDELINKTESLVKCGITQLEISDIELSSNKKRLLSVLNAFQTKAPNILLNLVLDISIIDREVCDILCELYCSLTFPVKDVLVDKKLFSKKAAILNDYGIVFGFAFSFGLSKEDSLKLTKERLDFLLSLYPNHMEFSQLQDEVPLVPTQFFSSINLQIAKNVCFACDVFYTLGRAVPWFLSVLEPLKIKPFQFFADFSEWQACNNCAKLEDFNFDRIKHEEIEKMQLLFIQIKYEEKQIEFALTAVNDLIKIHGAFSRLVSDNQESVLSLSYNPDDLLSSDAMDILSFVDQVCMDSAKIKVYEGKEGPDIKIL